MKNFTIFLKTVLKPIRKILIHYFFIACLIFQIQSQGKSSPTGPPKQANKLDNMLGSLQSDLNRLGVQTVAKGVCGACKKPIVGQVGGCTPLGRTTRLEGADTSPLIHPNT